MKKTLKTGNTNTAVKIKKSLEEIFEDQLEAKKLVNFTQYKFHPTRKWRFDFAWPNEKLAVEVQGGVFSGGAHVRGLGYTNDCIKLYNAALLGWIVLYVTSPMVRDGTALEMVRIMLEKLNENRS